MIYKLSATAVVFVPRPEATGVADAMLQTEYDTSLPVFHPFARMAMCQKASRVFRSQRCLGFGSSSRRCRHLVLRLYR